MAPREPLWIGTGASYSPEEDRLLLSNLLQAPRATFVPSSTLASRPGHGIVRSGDFTVTQDDVPGMRVKVSSGSAFIAGSEAAEQGVYAVRNDGNVVVNLAAADAVNRRNDIIIARVQDADYSGAVRSFVVDRVQGANYAGAHNDANDPVLPANSLALARVRVAPGAASILNASVNALHKFAPVAGRRRGTRTERLAALNLDVGEEWFETGTDIVWTWTGAAWRGESRGTSNIATDAGGNVIVPHGLGVAPTVVMVNLTTGSTFGTIAVAKPAIGTMDATNFVVTVIRSDTSLPLASNAIVFMWVAIV